MKGHTIVNDPNLLGTTENQMSRILKLLCQMWLKAWKERHRPGCGAVTNGDMIEELQGLEPGEVHHTKDPEMACSLIAQKRERGKKAVAYAIASTVALVAFCFYSMAIETMEKTLVGTFLIAPIGLVLGASIVISIIKFSRYIEYYRGIEISKSTLYVGKAWERILSKYKDLGLIRETEKALTEPTAVTIAAEDIIRSAYQELLECKAIQCCLTTDDSELGPSLKSIADEEFEGVLLFAPYLGIQNSIAKLRTEHLALAEKKVRSHRENNPSTSVQA